jgi:hypothetical protein
MSGERYRLTWASSFYRKIGWLVSEEKTFKQFSHRSYMYVKTMSADGGHFWPRSGSLNTILAVEEEKILKHFFPIWSWHEWSLNGQLSKIYPVTQTSIQDGHHQQTVLTYVKSMSANSGHFGLRSGSLNTILEVDHLRTIDDMFAILAYWFNYLKGSIL